MRREGAAWAAPSLEAFGARAGSAEYLELGALANKNPPELDTHDRYGRRDRPGAVPSLLSRADEGCDRGGPAFARPGRDPREGAHVARAARSYMQTQVEAGHGCPITMTFASVPCLKDAARSRRAMAAEDRGPTSTIRATCRSIEKAGVTIGMAMTEKQGGSDVRANTTRAIPLAPRAPGQAYELVGHKCFVSAPMCDAFLVLAQAPRRPLLFSRAALAPRRRARTRCRSSG